MPTVREFARLTTDADSSSIDQVTITRAAFDWLVEYARGGPSSLGLVSMDGSRSLRVLNFVGVFETPCGTRIEVLPKYTVGEEDIGEARSLLMRMVAEALRLKPRSGSPSQISAFKLPLPEWLAHSFLEEVSDLIRRGLRQSYCQVDAREPFLRGALDVSRQIRSGPAGAHMFAFRHDIFSFNRAENRLIRSGLEFVLRSTRVSDNSRLARELSAIFATIPESREISADLRQWSTGRLMAEYAAIKPLCELILLRQTPLAIAGAYRGISMLFPMEKLFENYVLASLRRAAPIWMRIRPQVNERHLSLHENDGWLRLKPDIIVTTGNDSWIVDAK